MSRVGTQAGPSARSDAFDAPGSRNLRDFLATPRELLALSDRLALDAVLARLAVAAYQRESVFQQMAAELGADHARLVSRGAAQMGVARFGRNRVLAPRGTSSVIDVAFDLAAKWRRPWRELPGTLHRGFAAQTNCLMPDVGGELAETELVGGGVALVGHSLGGAIAKLAAIASTRAPMYLPVHHVVTYGGPREGDQEFADYYTKELGRRTTRYVKVVDGQPDPVACIAPVSWGYKHTERVSLLQCDHGSWSLHEDLNAQVREWMGHTGDLSLLGYVKRMRQACKLIDIHDSAGYSVALDAVAEAAR